MAASKIATGSKLFHANDEKIISSDFETFKLQNLQQKTEEDNTVRSHFENIFMSQRKGGPKSNQYKPNNSMSKISMFSSKHKGKAIKQAAK